MAAKIKGAGGKAKAVKADVSQTAESKRLIDAAVDEFGRAAAMGEQGGAIINIGSVASLSSPPGGAVYSSSKAALDSITKTLAAELGPRKIRVNAVLPGPVETEGAQSLPDWDQFKSMLLPRTPLGRTGQPHDVATVVTFLASEDAGWITGEIISVAGGLR